MQDLPPPSRASLPNSSLSFLSPKPVARVRLHRRRVYLSSHAPRVASIPIRPYLLHPWTHHQLVPLARFCIFFWSSSALTTSVPARPLPSGPNPHSHEALTGVITIRVEVASNSRARRNPFLDKIAARLRPRNLLARRRLSHAAAITAFAIPSTWRIIIHRPP